MAKKKRSAAQKAATRRMIAANQSKGGKRSKKKRKGKARSKQIPLPILRKRLIKLSTVIRNRTS